MNEKLRNHRTYTKGLYQLSEASKLQGIIEPLIGMPDLTPSYGLPVGGIVATDAETGAISLNALGGDINCGVSLSQTNVPRSTFFNGAQLNKDLCRPLANNFKNSLVPNNSPNGFDYESILLHGVTNILSENEWHKIENNGGYEVLFNWPLDELKEIARKQLGTLGSGNHFIDLLCCDEVYDENLAMLWGLNQINVQFAVHSGSRGIGAYVKNKFSSANDNSFDLTEKIFQPKVFMSKEGSEILDFIHIASNFGYANRARLRQIVNNSLLSFRDDVVSDLIYDFGHNNISLEDFNDRKVLLHRKGAIRAYPPHHPANISVYLETGSPIIIPGSLGTATYVLVGTDKLKETFYSLNHGAGRKHSRGYVRAKKHHPRFQENLENVFVNLGFKDYCEETPNAYKDIEEVIKTLEINGFVKRVAKLKPFFVYIEKDKRIE